MKRHVLIAGLFLLFGAVINVAVAWLSAVLVNPWWADAESGMTTGPTGTFSVQRYSRPGSTAYDHNSRTFFLEGESRDARRAEDVLPAWARLPKILDSARVSENYWFEARGWPMRYLWSQGSNAILEHRWIKGPVEGGLDIGLRPWDSYLSSPRVLPLRPIWLGFAVDTVFYGALLWLFVRGPGHLRRHKRIRRGQCPSCGYPCAGSPICTECGHQLRR